MKQYSAKLNGQVQEEWKRDVPQGGSLITLSCSSFFVCSFYRILSRSRWIYDGSDVGMSPKEVGLNEGPIHVYAGLPVRTVPVLGLVLHVLLGLELRTALTGTEPREPVRYRYNYIHVT